METIVDEVKLLERIASILKAIAHPQRVGIVRLLEHHAGGLSVSEICEKMDMEQSLTSHHLANMRQRDILRTQREGKQVIYSLRSSQISKILRCVEHFDLDDEVAD